MLKYPYIHHDSIGWYIVINEHRTYLLVGKPPTKIMEDSKEHYAAWDAGTGNIGSYYYANEQDAENALKLWQAATAAESGINDVVFDKLVEETWITNI